MRRRTCLMLWSMVSLTFEAALGPEPCSGGEALYPGAEWPTASPDEMGMDEALLRQARDYALLWWNNADGTLASVPRDAYWSWGLYDSLIVVIPSLDMVVARAGSSWKRAERADHYDVLKPFLGPIAASVRGDAAADNSRKSEPAGVKPPYPPSPAIRAIAWSPKETIVRRARGGDNWPITWGDDDALYTAYGDGRGFEPFIETKVSMGLARIIGGPGDFRGINLRAVDIEHAGEGARGRKASGMLMVNGRLYMLVRNAANSQLAWSDDHGRAWQWASWRFTESFGCPTFLNFGRNYAGARDEFVYIYSQDSDSAYQPGSDHMVLARVPKDKVLERDAYEFFVRRDDQGAPVWTRGISQRGAAFEHPRNCYRSSVCYNAAIKRYLWWQVLPEGEIRFAGGFGVYDAPEPWGPWTTAYFTEQWDVGPGESAFFPAKWISEDGRTMYLVFSGDDCFSVRKGVLTLR